MSQTIGHPVWREVIDMRRAWHAMPGASVEYRNAGDGDWGTDLLNAAIAVTDDLDGDPREMLVRVVAIASAWIDAMDERPGVDQ
jgi:hypothetical protein